MQYKTQTALTAKIVFMTNRFDSYLAEDGKGKVLTLQEIYKSINSGEIEIECIDDALTLDHQPVIIIKDKQHE